MTLRRFVVPITVDANGDATAYSPVLSGKLVSFRYIKPGSGGFDAPLVSPADQVEFTITAEDTGETLWAESNVTASATRYPRASTDSVAGVDATYDGTYVVQGKIALSQDRVKFVIANAGDETTGTFHITIDG